MKVDKLEIVVISIFTILIIFAMITYSVSQKDCKRCQTLSIELKKAKESQAEAYSLFLECQDSQIEKEEAYRELKMLQDQFKEILETCEHKD
jgi:hypothetical protein